MRRPLSYFVLAFRLSVAYKKRSSWFLVDRRQGIGSIGATGLGARALFVFGLETSAGHKDEPGDLSGEKRRKEGVAQHDDKTMQSVIPFICNKIVERIFG